MTLDQIEDVAAASLPVRCQYARQVIRGYQRWSGSDLKGAASRYGAGYARQRARAANALHQAGGIILAIEKGLLVTACRACVDDYGNEVYETHSGYAWPHTRAQYRTGA